MLVGSGREPLALRAGVTSPGGTTAAAIRELEESGIRFATRERREVNRASFLRCPNSFLLL